MNPSPSNSNPETAAPSKDFPAVRASVEEGISSKLHSGAQFSIAVGAGGYAWQYHGAYGQSEPGETLTPGHLMLWMSACKPIVAVAVAQLEERGLVSYDDPVALHIPEFAENEKESVTIYHLLTHTSGLRLAEAVSSQTTDWETVIRRICSVKLEKDWVPGKKAGYHISSSWFVLGEIVRRVGGLPLSQYCRKNIFEPCGMSETRMGIPFAEQKILGTKVAKIHEFKDGDLRPDPTMNTVLLEALRPASNVWGPASDLLKFYQMMLAGGASDERRVIKPDTARDMVFRHRERMFDETFKHTMDVGLGFMLNSARYGQETLPYGFGGASDSAFGHSGSQCSLGFADPEKKLAAVIIFNGRPGEKRHQARVRDFHRALENDLSSHELSPSGTST